MKWILLLMSLAVFVAADGKVVVLTDDTFDATINGGKPVLVKFYAPWCGHCKALAPEYEKLAEEVEKSEDKIVIAELDCTVHKQTAGKYEVQGYPTIKYFIDGQPLTYEGERKMEPLLEFVKEKLKPSSKELKSKDELKGVIEEKSRRCILVSDKAEDLKEFMNTGRAMEGFSFYHTSEKVGRELFPKVSKASVVILRDFGEKEIIHENGFRPEKLLPLLKGLQFDVVSDFDKEAVKEIFEKGRKAVLLFYGAPLPDNMEKIFRDFAKSKESEGLLFLKVASGDDWGQRLFEYFAIDASETPLVEIVDMSSGEPQRFRHSGRVEFSELAQFMEKYKKGEIPKHIKTQPVPAKNEGPVFTVVGSTFHEEVINNDKDVLVKFYAEWCGHCKKLAPIYAAVAESLKTNLKLKLVEIDATKNDVEGVAIKGFPTLYLYPAGKKDSPVPFEGERDEEGFIKFLKEHCTNSIELPKKDL